MHSRANRTRRWVLIPLVVLLLTVTGFAVQQSVTVRVGWKVLPYQTLRLVDSDREVDAVSLEIPDPTPLDVSRGYIELEHAVRLYVASNTPWKIQITAPGLSEPMASLLEVRSHGDAYGGISDQPRVLAAGSNGTFEISIDVRVMANSDGTFPSSGPVNLVYTLMSN
jgi:hypothetical protein